MDISNEYVEAQKFLETLDWDGIPNSGEPLATICDALQEIQKYKYLEEQGLLLRLPCKVGDSIYSVVEDGLTIVELKFSLDFYARRKNDFGKTIFLTKAEAEQKLKEMEGD